MSQPFRLPLYFEPKTDESPSGVMPAASARPKTRGDCLPGGMNESRPCKQSWCKWHLSSEKASCVLDVADEGATLDEVGDIFGVSRERVRQIEEIALRKLARRQGEITAWKKD